MPAQALSTWRTFAVLHGIDHRYDIALQAPQPASGPLDGLKGKDVYLVFVESYGTVALDDPGYRAILGPALADFAATTQGAGYTLLSNRLVSPVFGGGSWLAHGTIASGLKLDPLLNELVLNGNRNSLPRYLKAAGYRAVEVMPGIKQPDPEAAFWGFDQHYFAAQLGYAGPEFGWFDIPDQYTLAQFTAHELTSRSQAALRADRAGVEPYTVRAGAPLSRRLARCGQFQNRAGGRLAAHLCPARLERSRSALSRQHRLRSEDAQPVAERPR